MPATPHWKMATTPRHLSLNYMICINSLRSIFSRSHIHSHQNTHTLRQRAFELGKCCKKCHYEVHFETGSNVKSDHLQGKWCFDGMILQRAQAWTLVRHFWWTRGQWIIFHWKDFQSVRNWNILVGINLNCMDYRGKAKGSEETLLAGIQWWTLIHQVCCF